MVIASPVKGLRPGRALVAGLCTVFNVISPLKLNSPQPFLPRAAAMVAVSTLSTSFTLAACRSVPAVIVLTRSPLARRFVAGVALNAFFFVGAIWSPCDEAALRAGGCRPEQRVLV